MKKALQININDKIYYIDDDAYALLSDYLRQLCATFPGDEGREIVTDIENRVGELFSERIASGYNVIDIDYLNQVIDMVGHPEQLGDELADASDSAAQPSGSSSQQQPDDPPVKKKLYRSLDDKVFGGVIGGLALYLGWNANVMRLLVVVLALCTAVLPFVICYLVAWMVIPPADTPRRELEMRGIPVNISTLGQKVKDRLTPPPFHGTRRKTDFSLSEIFGICGKIIAAFLGLLFGIVGVVVGTCLIAAFIILVVSYFASPFEFGQALVGPGASVVHIHAQSWWAVTLSAAIVLLSILVVWWAGTMLFGWRSIGKGTAIIVSALIVAALAVAVLLSIHFVAINVPPVPFTSW